MQARMQFDEILLTKENIEALPDSLKILSGLFVPNFSPDRIQCISKLPGQQLVPIQELLDNAICKLMNSKFGKEMIQKLTNILKDKKTLEMINGRLSQFLAAFSAFAALVDLVHNVMQLFGTIKAEGELKQNLDRIKANLAAMFEPLVHANVVQVLISSQLAHILSQQHQSTGLLNERRRLEADWDRLLGLCSSQIETCLNVCACLQTSFTNLSEQLQQKASHHKNASFWHAICAGLNFINAYKAPGRFFKIAFGIAVGLDLANAVVDSSISAKLSKMEGSLAQAREMVNEFQVQAQAEKNLVLKSRFRYVNAQQGDIERETITFFNRCFMERAKLLHDCLLKYGHTIVFEPDLSPHTLPVHARQVPPALYQSAWLKYRDVTAAVSEMDLDFSIVL